MTRLQLDSAPELRRSLWIALELLVHHSCPVLVLRLLWIPLTSLQVSLQCIGMLLASLEGPAKLEVTRGLVRLKLHQLTEMVERLLEMPDLSTKHAGSLVLEWLVGGNGNRLFVRLHSLVEALLCFIRLSELDVGLCHFGL